MTNVIVLLIITTVLIFAISTLSGHLKQDDAKHVKELNKEIMVLEEKKKQLIQTLENNQLDSNVRLQKIVVQVLDEYDRLEIKIPADIIESLSIMIFESEKEVKTAIEKLRHSWKLENSKKI